MPAFSADQDGEAPILLERLTDGFQNDCRFNRLTLAVMKFEQPRERNRLHIPADREQFSAQAAPSHPSAGIDPGSENEPAMVKGERWFHACDRCQGANSGAFELRKERFCRSHEGAIDALQWNDVAYGRQAHEVETLAQIRLGYAVCGEPPGLAKCPGNGHREEKSYARRAKITKPG